MHGHVEAFKAFGGVPARSVYDNLTPVVKKILFPGRVLKGSREQWNVKPG